MNKDIVLSVMCHSLAKPTIDHTTCNVAIADSGMSVKHHLNNSYSLDSIVMDELDPPKTNYTVRNKLLREDLFPIKDDVPTGMSRSYHHILSKQRVNRRG